MAVSKALEKKMKDGFKVLSRLNALREIKYSTRP